MSGCHPKEALQKCPHDIPVKFNCAICNINACDCLCHITNQFSCFSCTVEHSNLEGKLFMAQQEKHVIEAPKYIVGKEEFTEKMHHIAKVFNNFEKAIDKIEADINLLKKSGTEISQEKRPFKCPVCEGKILSEIKIQKTESGRDNLVVECHACEGKGIVWG